MERPASVPDYREISHEELENLLKVGARFIEGLTGLGGDLEYRHKRGVFSVEDIQIETRHASSEYRSLVTFAEGSTCAGQLRGHACMLRPTNEYSEEATAWTYTAAYRIEEEGEPHRAAAHVSHPEGARPTFDVTIRFRNPGRYSSSLFRRTEAHVPGLAL